MARQLSTSDSRRQTVIHSAISVFAQSGYLGTPIASIAQHAKISQAYVFKLFPSKEGLFVAALGQCFSLIHTALSEGADSSADQSPEGVLYSMGGAYAALIANRDLLMLQVHALSAADTPEIRTAFRHGLEKLTTFVKARSNAPDESVQRFFAYGQLCHLITTISLDHDQSSWARVLTTGIRHP